MRKKLFVWTVILSASFGGRGYADVVTDWNEVLLEAIRLDRTAPPTAARAMAMVHIAVYDAVNGIERTHEPYHVEPAAPVGASARGAAVAAAHGVLVELYPAQQARFDAERAASLLAIANGQAKTDGIAWGETVADAILDLRADDGSDAVADYTPSGEIGFWVPTPPGFAAGALPQWGNVTPFAMTSGSQFRTGGPPSLDSTEYAAGFNDVKQLGRVDSAMRTAEQSEIAQFWVNGPGTETPPGHWNTIAQQIVEQEGNTLAQNARLFALLNIAVADAAIASWDNKYLYDHWRPVTAVRNADQDGNDETEIDAEWSSFIPTPPFPEYTSGHSTFSGAASKVLELFFGADDVPFETSSDGLPGVVRSYSSFSQAADESGRSRIYGGIHFEYANQDGLSSGRALGEFVFAGRLKALEPGDGGTRMCGLLGQGNLILMAGMLLGLRLVGRGRQR